ncbi:MAG TPA: response regulator transcription factor [Symbiobacteriaceae bacterium]|jgi:DNA-binding response OmpR family regulator
MSLVLIVDDDVKIVSVIRLYLNQAGYETAEAYDGAAALELCRRLNPDLVVLDWMLPTIDGIAVLERLRAKSTVLVLMLTARVAIEDKLAGLETGADDYLTKPFHPQELVARVKVLLRRTSQRGAPVVSVLTHGPLSMDPDRHEVTLNGTPVPALTAIEFRLLQSLMEHPGRIRTRDALLEHIYSFGEKYVLDRTIDAHIGKVRAKLRAADPDCDLIITVRGIGYKLGGTP